MRHRIAHRAETGVQRAVGIETNYGSRIIRVVAVPAGGTARKRDLDRLFG